MKIDSLSCEHLKTDSEILHLTANKSSLFYTSTSKHPQYITILSITQSKISAIKKSFTYEVWKLIAVCRYLLNNALVKYLAKKMVIRLDPFPPPPPQWHHGHAHNMTSQPHPLADVIITCQVKICCKCYDFLYHIFLNIQRVFESKNGKLKTQSQSKLRRDIYIYFFCCI